MIFEKNITNMLVEREYEQHMIAREDLDPTVFQTFDDGTAPRLHDGIKAQLITDVTSLETIVPVVAFYITGDILSPYYAVDTEIAVFIEVDPESIDNIATAEILFSLRRINGRLAPNSQHPINYYVVPEEVEMSKLNAVYDVVNERWAKLPEKVSSDLVKHLTKFHETIASIEIEEGNLQRNTVSFKEIQQMSDMEIEALRYELQKQYDELQRVIKQMTLIHKDKDLTQLANDDTLTKGDIHYSYKKYKLPESFIIKIYEKYYFLKFMKKLDDLLNKNGEFDVQDLMNSEIGKKFWRA